MGLSRLKSGTTHNDTLVKAKEETSSLKTQVDRGSGRGLKRTTANETYMAAAVVQRTRKGDENKPVKDALP